MTFILVAIGGFIGSISRFYISMKVNKRLIGTWTANITGSIFLAFVLHFHLLDTISDQVWLLLGVGFCGSYTTFSTFGNETLQLIFDKRYGSAIGYVLSSLTASFFCVAIILHIL